MAAIPVDSSLVDSITSTLTDETIDSDLAMDGFDATDRYPEHGHDALRSAYRSGHASGASAAIAASRREMETLRGDVNHLVQPIIGALRWAINGGKQINTADLEHHASQLYRALDAIDAALGEEPLRDQLAAAQHHPKPVGPDEIEAGSDRADGRVYTWQPLPVIHR